jgi:hypothetical protein
MQLGKFGYYADFYGGFASSFILCAFAMSHGTWLSRAEWLGCLMLGIGLWTLFGTGFTVGSTTARLGRSKPLRPRLRPQVLPRRTGPLGGPG